MLNRLDNHIAVSTNPDGVRSVKLNGMEIAHTIYALEIKSRPNPSGAGVQDCVVIEIPVARIEWDTSDGDLR